MFISGFTFSGAQNYEKPERDLYKTNDDLEQVNSEAMEIDLKCAEKVTDSDVESNADDKVKHLSYLIRFFN